MRYSLRLRENWVDFMRFAGISPDLVDLEGFSLVEKGCWTIAPLIRILITNSYL